MLTQVVSSYRPRFRLLMGQDDILARAHGESVQGAQPHGLDLDHLPTSTQGASKFIASSFQLAWRPDWLCTYI